MITQYEVNLPEGKSTPDFQCKPVPVTVQEGTFAVFTAVVKGDPKPEVSWRRAKGNTADKEKYLRKYDESTGEHVLEANTYKCCAANEFGKAVCTATLSVTDGKNSTNPSDFRKLLRKSKVAKADEESDEKFWESMLNADRNDYERICAEFGVSDLHSVLKKLGEKKKERMRNKCKDGVIPYDDDAAEKLSLLSGGRTKDFILKSPMLEDEGLTPLDVVEKLKLLETGSNVDFVVKIQEIKAEEREDALFECVLTHPLPSVTWSGKGSALEDGEKYIITGSDHKLIHRLLIRDCEPQDEGIYSAAAGATSCSAWLVVEADGDPACAGEKKPRKATVAGGARLDLEKVAKEQQIKNREETEKILAAVRAKQDAGQVREGQTLLTSGRRDGELTESTQDAESDEATAGGLSGETTKMKNSTGNDANLDVSVSGTKAEATVDGTENKKYRVKYHLIKMTLCAHFCFVFSDPPRFNTEDLSAFSEPVRVKVGHSAIFKLHFLGHEPIKIKWYREGEELRDDGNTKVERFASHSRLLLSRCHRKESGEVKIKLRNEHGFVEAVSRLVVLDKPTSPLGPAEVTESSPTCIEFKWRPPKDDGGSPVTNYAIERQQVGRNTWKRVGEIPGVPSFRDTDVDHGRKYCYRVRAITAEGTSEVMETDDMQAGTLAFPGPPAPPKVASAFDDCINLCWSSPSNTGGSRILGFILEKRKKGVICGLYAVKDVVAGLEYEFRVTALNLSGAGEFSNASEFVFARDPKSKFDNVPSNFLFLIPEPPGKVTGLKDNVPVTKRATISNSDGSSQLLIPSSERSDSGIYSILVKNLAGQETFSTEVRVTDDPKPPGPVDLEENVPGTLTVTWEASPDEKRDDRLHYTVSKLDSTKRTWATVADRLFNNKVTVCNIMHGREYLFRVYAKNDIGISAPSESPTWGREKKKGEKDCDLRCAPTVVVPLKLHTAPKGYECYMSCAVRGNPAPRVTWYRNHVSLNTNTNYYISNTCGVCSMLILRVGPRDTGEYSISAENALGRAESSTILSVRGETQTHPHFHSENNKT
uniref:Immunoglobulin-like and fibronectin type III domain-containing protein 1 n=1 Tax=Scophthalmus maximus TaxID=52904 RepID=A0A8D2ZYG8_SCOMX